MRARAWYHPIHMTLFVRLRLLAGVAALACSLTFGGVVEDSQKLVKDGKFETSLELPMKLPWPRLIVRAYAYTAKDDAFGAADVKVVKNKR